MESTPPTNTSQTDILVRGSVTPNNRALVLQKSRFRSMGDYNGSSSAVPRSGISLQHSDAAKIFVGGLSWQTTEESLRWHFEQYGTVISVEVMRDRHTGDPRGFAFVVFSDPSTLDLVMKDKDKHEINHKFVDVKRAQARGVAPPSIHEGSNPSSNHNTSEQDLSPEQKHSKVFIGGIPHHVDSDELKRIFSQFGVVTDAIVMLDQTTQRSRGFGFVTFETAEAASASIANQPVDVHGRGVEVKLATPRTDQQRGGALPPAPKHLGLRAGQSSNSTGKYAGLAVAYGRSGWKAGYGTKAFGKAGWNIWEDTVIPAPERAGFSFGMLENRMERPLKRQKQH